MRRIAWMVPFFGEGSGGGRTILQNIEYLEKEGYKCDVYVGPKADSVSFSEIIRGYGVNLQGKVFASYELMDKYDMAIATYYATAKEVAKTNCKHKVYFMQDYEPWFFPMSINYLDAVDSYRYGLKGVTIGQWLTHKIQKDYKIESRFFNFCADTSVYRPLKNSEREKAVCFVFQPEKPRRMVDTGLKALQILQHDCPDVKIYLYGSQKMIPHNIRAEHLGMITPEECNGLYNKCKVGLCLSATNPSRVPFEMMAAGLPVVEMYGENTIYDFPDEGCLLAERNPESIARAIKELLNDDAKWQSLHDGGYNYMKDYPIERGFREFKEIIDGIFDKKDNAEMIKSDAKKLRYKKDAVVEKKRSDLNIDDVFFATPESSLKKKLSEVKHAISAFWR
ncbi:MAG: glycosyltransferase [Candidatus Saccharibacteria bacterium]|nr:glycosyltransferase [Candidatus Saccharibacteria bacterium]